MSMAVRRVAAVMEALAESGGATAADLADRLTVTRPALGRLLESMLSAEIIQKDRPSNSYRLTLKVYLWGSRAALPFLPHQTTREEMARLSQIAQRPVYFAALLGDQIVGLERTETTDSHVMSVPAPGRALWSVSAHGIVCAAYSPPGLLESLPKNAKANGGTAVEQEVRNMVEAARCDGYSIMPSAVHGYVLSAPVLDRTCHAVGSLGIAVRTEEYDSTAKNFLLDSIKESAARCSARLGYIRDAALL